MGPVQVLLDLDGPREKRCSTCREVKPIGAFAYASIAKGTRQANCRECHAKARRAHYEANRERYTEMESARITARGRANRERLIAYLREHPCVDCGETDITVLEFDHRQPLHKKGDVGVMAARRSWTAVLREIEKCDVRCANCHAKRTAEEFGWRKVGIAARRGAA